MIYTSEYASPLGKILLAADAVGLCGAWFEGQRYYPSFLASERKEISVLTEAKRWLDVYFSEKKPDIDVPLHFIGTDFQKTVWEILCSIPYGKTATYGDVADALCKKHNLKRMSARAVGGVVGRNKISIIVPCHRVVGANGKLTGYAGGLERKISLLRYEGIKM